VPFPNIASTAAATLTRRLSPRPTWIIGQQTRVRSEYLTSGRSLDFGVAEVLVEYLKFAKGYFGTGIISELHRIKFALRPAHEVYSDHDAADFGPKQCKAVRKSMVQAELSRPGINARMKRLVRMFRLHRKPSSTCESTCRESPSLWRRRFTTSLVR